MRTSRLLSSLNSFKKKTKNNFLQDGNAHVSPSVQLEQLVFLILVKELPLFFLRYL